MILRKPATRRVSFFRYALLLLIAASSLCTSHAQGISGTVSEAFSHHPIPDATISISLNDTTLYTTMTDSLGHYIYTIPHAGRYLIEANAEGYLPTLQADIILDGYSTRTVDLSMEKTSWILTPVIVSAMPKQTTPYIRTITADDMVSTAGNYDDPVRAALSDPGMVALNDQANHFSARGKSPVFNTWQLEGLDIVNPNHTSNAGTFSDLPTQYGGGVNMFSAQTLGSTDLFMGINPVQVNNLSGATTNMHLHESAIPEMRVKAGLLGFEFGGSNQPDVHNTIDFNVRYSFTGLLTTLGADFGGERISYYDGVLSWRNTGAHHTLKTFAWYGYSENLFDHRTDTAEIEEYKDFFDINYGNSIIGLGSTYTHTLGAKSSLHAGAAWSTNETIYERFGTFETHTDSINDRDRINLLSAFIECSIPHSTRIKSLIGINYKNRSYSTDDVNSYSYLPFPEESMMRPYVNTAIDFSPSLHLDVGLDLSWSLSHPSADPGYRASLQWNTGDRSIVFAGLRHGAGEASYSANKPFRPPHILNTFYEAGWNLVGARHSLTIDAYAHRMDRLLRLDLSGGYVHMADYPYDRPNTLWPASYTTDASALYYGVEGQWEYRNSGWRCMVNQSLYHSARDNAANQYVAGRYNGQYATHLVLAREIIRERNGKSRIWNIGLRAMWHGGLWEQQIDTLASAQYYTTIYTVGGNFNRRIQDYRRLDLSIVRTVGDSKVRWRYALDIQNVLGLTNVAYTYYDPYLKQVVDQQQLGLIPVLSVQASW